MAFLWGKVRNIFHGGGFESADSWDAGPIPGANPSTVVTASPPPPAESLFDWQKQPRVPLKSRTTKSSHGLPAAKRFKPAGGTSIVQPTCEGRENRRPNGVPENVFHGFAPKAKGLKQSRKERQGRVRDRHFLGKGATRDFASRQAERSKEQLRRRQEHGKTQRGAKIDAKRMQKQKQRDQTNQSTSRPTTSRSAGQPTSSRSAATGQPTTSRSAASGQPTSNRSTATGQPTSSRSTATGQPTSSRSAATGQPTSSQSMGHSEAAKELAQQQARVLRDKLLQERQAHLLREKQLQEREAKLKSREARFEQILREERCKWEREQERQKQANKQSAIDAEAARRAQEKVAADLKQAHAKQQREEQEKEREKERAKQTARQREEKRKIGQRKKDQAIAQRVRKRQEDMRAKEETAKQTAIQREAFLEQLRPAVLARVRGKSYKDLCLMFLQGKARLPPKPDRNTLRRTLRRAMARYHPDRTQHLDTLKERVEAELIFDVLKEAYEELVQYCA